MEIRMKTILKKYCKLSGRSVTNQRKLLLELIRSERGHLGADELFRRAKEQGSRISLATVYRNLKLFQEIGLISESKFGETRSYYEMRGPAEHHHLVCRGCGRVEEFDSPLVAEARVKVQQEKGFDIVSVQLKIEGYCPKCQARVCHSKIRKTGDDHRQ